MEKQLKQELKDVLKVVKRVRRKQERLFDKHCKEHFCWQATNKGEREAREIDFLDTIIQYTNYIIKNKDEFDQ